MAWKFFIIAFIGVCAAAVPLENEINGQNENFIPINSMAKCAENGGVTGILNCAAMRSLKSLQFYAKQTNLEVLPGIILTSDDPNIQRVGKELSDNELPTDPIEKADKLFGLLVENAARVFSGRTLKVKMPENVVESVSRALEEEGRGRKGGGGNKGGKKGGMFGKLMLGLGAKMFTIIPAAIAGLGLISTKALIIAKIAFVLAVILFFQNFSKSGNGFLSSLGGGGHYGSSIGGTSYGSYSPPTWTTNQIGGGSSGSYPYARSLDDTSAQELAYSHQKQS